jgi:glycosyltransferase involved in cell wall biosynthesis
LRILLIHSFYRPGQPSGENDVVLNQRDLLLSRGYDVEIWGPTSPADMGMAQKLATGLRVSVGKGQDPRAFIKGFKPDLIHIHNLFPNISVQWLDHSTAPVAMSIHNYRTVCANGVLIRDSRPCTDCLTGSSLNAVRHGCYQNSRAATLPVIGFQRQLRLVIERNVDKLIFTSELSRDVLSPLLVHRSSVLLPNYVAGAQRQNSSGPDTTHPYYVVLGRLSPEKGIAQLLRIWPRHLNLVIVGDGPQRAELETLADPSSVTFRGFVGAEERDAILSGAKALVLPSVTLEADPLVVAQALSVGTPCVIHAQTSSARLADRSLAVRTYQDLDSLEAGIEGVNGSAVREAARALYQETWSADSWLDTYKKSVLSELVK